MSVRLLPGDCIESMRSMPANSIDAVVTDPPYHLLSTVKRFANSPRTESTMPKSEPHARMSVGFMGKTWDGGDIAFRAETWAEVLRVLKPGGHMVAFGAPKNAHRLACAIEDAGFEMRDLLMWLFGSGFPKSLDVSKAIDKHLGAKREQVRVDAAQVRNSKATGAGRDGMEGATRPWIEKALEVGYHEKDGDDPATAAAAAWQGWGTALKPAYEPIILARKPIEGTNAENVLRFGVGALNIDASRVPTDDDLNGGAYAEKGGRTESPSLHAGSGMNVPGKTVGKTFEQPTGRWPANVIHDGSDEVLAAFPAESSVTGKRTDKSRSAQVAETQWLSNNHKSQEHTDSGSPARFFYCAKANKKDRAGSKHPTVKPIALMRYLCRLITPPGGTILDPFAGSGTTGQAASEEGFDAILCEREAEYIADINRRLGLDDAFERMLA